MAEPTLDATNVEAFTVEGKQSAVIIPTILNPAAATGDQLAELPPTPDSNAPTEREKRTLRKVADKLPWAAFIICAVELCERFAFYGLSGPFQNYMQHEYGDVTVPGALGLGQKAATGLSNFFNFWCYVTPIIGAIISDQWLGKYRTIFYSAIIYMVGILVLVLTSVPIAIEKGAALGGLITAMIIIGMGTGGIKSNVSPLVADQYENTRPFIKTLKSGERVIVDPATTISRIMTIFYLTVNIGSLSNLATTALEAKVDFWAAYLLPLIMFLVGFLVLVVGRSKYKLRPAGGSAIPKTFKIIWIAIKNKGNLDAARPEQENVEDGHEPKFNWSSTFVDEVKRALVACKVFLFFPIFHLVYSQINNNLISQAGTMELHGIPNDFMISADPLTIIIFAPMVSYLLYPALRKCGFQMYPVTRMFWGFLFAAAAMAYAAGVQKIIYKSGPCYSQPKACPAGLLPDGKSYRPNEVHVAIQIPAYLLIALSEIFMNITGIEYAYTKAPASMKSFITSLFLLTNAFGSALAMALSPLAVDPKLLYMYASLAVVSFVTGVVFWLLYRRYNATEESMNELSQTVEAQGSAANDKGGKDVDKAA